MKLGLIQYDRPSQPVSKADVEGIINLAGKDVIRMAWASLNPTSSGRIDDLALENWLFSFFNFKSTDDAHACISHLISIGLLAHDTKGYCRHWSCLYPKFDL